LPQPLFVALGTGIATVFFAVACQSYLPSLLGRGHLVEGNGKLETNCVVASMMATLTTRQLMQRKLLASDLSQSPNPVYSAKPKNPALGVLSRRRATGAAVRSMDRSTIQTLQLLDEDNHGWVTVGRPRWMPVALAVPPHRGSAPGRRLRGIGGVNR
jgi:hypothetical protein